MDETMIANRILLGNRHHAWTKIIFGLAAAIVLWVPLPNEASAARTKEAEAGEPFGLATMAVSEGPSWSAWQQLQSEIQIEKRLIAQCRAEPHACPSPAALRFIALVSEGDGYDGLVRVSRINRAVNFAMRYAAQADWTSPLTTLTTGVGDCKQYAVLKYAVLEEAGFGPDDLRLVIVRVKSLRRTHAVVALRHAAHWFILDNRTLVVALSTELLDYYQPLFTPDNRSFRQFIIAAPQR